MAIEKKIPGRPGSLKQIGPRGTVSDPTPAKIAELIEDNGQIYVVTGTARIPVRIPDRFLAPRIPAPAKERPDRATGTQKSAPAALKPAIEAADRHRHRLLANAEILSVRAGYLFENGAITDIPAVVLAVQNSVPGKPLDKAQIRQELGVPDQLDGIVVDYELADPFLQLAAVHGPEVAIPAQQPRLFIDQIQGVPEMEIETMEAEPAITYEPPPGGNLEPVTGAMTITCHVSPDAGWKVLEPFLKATERKLHLGMYDFTAPHIFQAARSLLKNSDVEWQQVLGPNESLPSSDDPDSTKADDKTEEAVVKGLRRVAGDRFGNAFAHVGAGKTFASAYHIKVAVRDDKSLWLSSGNWQSSNQPNIDFLAADADTQLVGRYNREWHVVVENATLAKRFQRYLDHDFEVASTADEAAGLLEERALPDVLVAVDQLLEEERGTAHVRIFAPKTFRFTEANPLTIQPILTPDNYLEVVLKFLRKQPKKKFYFQNQSLNPIQKPTPEYAELMELLARYSHEVEDARFIFRNIGPIRKKLESLNAAGFNMKRIRVQSGCHTKGIIVDSETVLLGSHNITNQGVQANRDASLLIRNADIANYYEAAFLHDWDVLARPTIREEAVPVVAVGGAEAVMVGGAEVARLPFSYVEEE